MPRVVWAEESKTGLRFEIGPSYDAVSTRSQLVTHRQSSCIEKLDLQVKSRVKGKNRQGQTRANQDEKETNQCIIHIGEGGALEILVGKRQ